MLVDTVRISRSRCKCGNRPAASRICHNGRVEAGHTLGYRGLSIQGPAMFKPKAVASTQHHSGRVIQVSTERLRYANGREYDIDYVRHPGAAAVVAVDGAAIFLSTKRRMAASTGRLLPKTRASLKQDLPDVIRRTTGRSGVSVGEIFQPSQWIRKTSGSSTVAQPSSGERRTQA